MKIDLNKQQNDPIRGKNRRTGLIPLQLSGWRLETAHLYLHCSQTTLSFRRRLRGQAALHAVEKSHQLREAGHPDEDDSGGVGAEGGDEGARPDRVLGEQDHLLRCPPFLPESLLLDLQVSSVTTQLSTPLKDASVLSVSGSLRLSNSSDT